MSFANSFSSLFQSVAFPRKVAGVEIRTNEGEVDYQVTIVEKKKNEVTTLDRFSVTDLKELPDNTPVTLTVNTRDVLHRTLQTTGEDIYQELESHLPNINLADFYIQVYENTSLSVVSLIRKEVLNNYLKELNELKKYPLQVSLAPFTVNSVIPFLNEEAELITSRFHISLDQGIISHYQPSDTATDASYLIGNERLLPNQLLSFSSAIQYFVPGNAVQIQDDGLSKQANEAIHQFRFKPLAIALLSVVFLVLMINFLVFSQKRSQLSQLQLRNKGTLQLVSQLNTLKKEYTNKEAFLRQAGWLNAPMSSKYIDRIVKTTPSSVNLSFLGYQPVDRELSRKERRDIYINNTILVKGSCLRPTVLNAWFNELEELSFSKEVKVNNYQDNRTTHLGEFEITISL